MGYRDDGGSRASVALGRQRHHQELRAGAPPSRSAVVVFTNAAQGMRLAEAIVNAASGSEHLAFDWI